MTLKKTIKSWLPKTLLARSLMILIVPIVLIQLVTTYIFFDRHWSNMMDRLAYALAGEIAIIADRMDQEGSLERFDRIRTVAANELDLVIGFIPDQTLPPTQKRESVIEELILQSLRKQLSAKLDYPYALKSDAGEEWVEVNVAVNGGVLEIVIPWKRFYSSTGYIFILWVYGASILLLLVAVLFMRNQIRPIRRLSVAAEKFGKGRESPKFKPEGASEVRRAAVAFLTMQKRIRRQMDQRTAMLAGVSHDLRTLVTRMKLNLTMMEGQGEELSSISNDLVTMEKMLAAYLNFAKGDVPEHNQFIDMNSFVRELVDELSAAYPERKLDYAVQKGAENSYLSIRPTSLRRCLSNIIENALSYGTNVTVYLQAGKEGWLEVLISDDGPGIPPDRYEAVFRPFVRLDSARPVSEGHSGLGLSIALDIAHAHGGDILLGQSEAGGLLVTVKLPE